MNHRISGISQGGSRDMPEGSFAKRLTFLWLGIVSVRSLLIYEFSSGNLLEPQLSIAYLIFLPTVVAIEVEILRRAAKEYRASPQPLRINPFGKSPAANVSTLSPIMMIALMMFCIPYALWSTRSSGMATLPLIVGPAVGLAANLSFTYWAAQILFLRRKRLQSQ
jgi:hypothetical protein